MGTEPADVEFVTSPGTEELLEREPRGLLRTGKRRWIAAGAAVAAVAIGLAVRAGTSHPEPAPRPTVAVTVPRYLPPPDVIGSPVAVPVNRGAGLPDSSVCTSVPKPCAAADQLPQPFLAAVRQYLGALEPVAQTDAYVGAHRQILFRRLAARGAHLGLEVTVRPAASKTTQSTTVSNTAAGVTATATQLAGPPQLLVTVTVTEPPGWHPPLTAIQDLAADLRLVR
jgi:hypothetical protein